MANKRMLSKQILECDSFLKLKDKSKLLYIMLNLYADDDGFCDNLFQIYSILKIKKNIFLEELENANLIYKFKNDIILIRHFKSINLIRKDRYKVSLYIHLLKENNIELNKNNIYNKIISNNNNSIFYKESEVYK